MPLTRVHRNFFRHYRSCRYHSLSTCSRSRCSRFCLKRSISRSFSSCLSSLLCSCASSNLSLSRWVGSDRCASRSGSRRGGGGDKGAGLLLSPSHQSLSASNNHSLAASKYGSKIESRGREYGKR